MLTEDEALELLLEEDDPDEPAELLPDDEELDEDELEELEPEDDELEESMKLSEMRVFRSHIPTIRCMCPYRSYPRRLSIHRLLWCIHCRPRQEQYRRTSQSKPFYRLRP